MAEPRAAVGERDGLLVAVAPPTAPAEGELLGLPKTAVEEGVCEAEPSARDEGEPEALGVLVAPRLGEAVTMGDALDAPLGEAEADAAAAVAVAPLAREPEAEAELPRGGLGEAQGEALSVGAGVDEAEGVIVPAALALPAPAAAGEALGVTDSVGGSEGEGEDEAHGEALAEAAAVCDALGVALPAGDPVPLPLAEPEPLSAADAEARAAVGDTEGVLEADDECVSVALPPVGLGLCVDDGVCVLGADAVAPGANEGLAQAVAVALAGAE